jgi:2-polyprenyl-6-methoxyphenol hydroxylase-like FAD-dependent oxidoreductase
MSVSDEARMQGGPHAVVLGAGIAGLVAARVLTEHFSRVTIVEQDQLPAQAAPRNGTPQSRHVHALLWSGREIFQQLFPGFEDDLARAGAPLLDGIKDIAWLSAAGWLIRYPSKYVGRAASRPLIEWTMYQRLLGDPRVTFVEGAAALGLTATADRARVTGVRTRPRRGDGSEATFAADLVVDATGRGSRATQWLRDLGYPEPDRTEIDAHLGYTSRLYRLREDPHRDWNAVYVQAKLPSDLRGGVLIRLENGEWLLTLGGYGRDYPPTDDEGFLAFARSLRSPLIYDSIRDAEPLTSAVATRSTANVWRHYERLTRWPDGFIAMGDAVCAFNPVYGQGMSVAAKEAVVLDTYLREQRRDDLTGFAPRFQKRIAGEVAPVWAIATSEDVKVPGVEGGQPRRSDRLIQAYMERVVALTTEDAFARNIFTQVTNLERPATLLFHPRLVAKVILGPTGRGNRSPMSTPVVA